MVRPGGAKIQAAATREGFRGHSAPNMNRSAPARGTAFLLFASLLTVSSLAGARKNGIQAAGCWGCHQSPGSTDTAMLALSADHDPIQPGDVVSFTATITAPNVNVGGIYVVKPDTGTLGTSAGQGLTLSDGALTHSSPKAAVNGAVTFSFTWTAPSSPGSVVLSAYVVAANGNNRNTGDVAGEGTLSFVYGCSAKTFYFDADGDGYGNEAAGTAVGCAEQPPPRGYAATGDDCDDAQKSVNPGAEERCNDKDDNCNGVADEDTMPEPLYPDPDGDGYYGSQPGMPVLGCLPLAGYADEPGDCAPIEPDKHPGAVEVCNLIDDDCDGTVDEGVRPVCGVGRCAREDTTCDPADCRAGDPQPETCNALDDDCNGIADDADELCPAGQACLGIHCVVVDDGSGTGGGGMASAAGSAASTSAGSPSGRGGGTSSTAGSGGAATLPASGAPDGTTNATGGRPPAALASAKTRGCSLGVTREHGAHTVGFGAALAGVIAFAVRRRRSQRSGWSGPSPTATSHSGVGSTRRREFRSKSPHRKRASQ